MFYIWNQRHFGLRLQDIWDVVTFNIKQAVDKTDSILNGDFFFLL